MDQYTAALAEPENEQVPKPANTPAEGNRYGGRGRLLELAQTNPAQVAKEITTEFERQDPACERRKVFWDVNTLQYRGIRGARAIPVAQQDRQWPDHWRLHVPLGSLETQPVLDRTANIVERVTAHLLADPPVPEPEPPTDTIEDRDAAEMTKRILIAESGTSGVNYLSKFRRAHQKAAITGSSFLYVWTDPTGGGQQPKRVQALPTATTLDDATIDPETGQEAPPEFLTERFMGPEGMLVDDERQAEKQWIPKLKMDVLNAHAVRFLPETAAGIEDADGALILYVRTLGELKDRFPAVREMSDEQMMKLVGWRPKALKWVLPWFARMGYSTEPVLTKDGKVDDSTLVACLARYQVVSIANPKGSYFTVAGGEFLLYSGEWMVTVEQDDGMVREEPRDIPLAQVRQLDDTDTDDPYGIGLVKKVGPADEVNGTIILAWLDYLDRVSRPNTWVPMGSTVEAEDLQNRLGLPLFYNAQHGVPVFEQMRPFDVSAKEFFDRSQDYQNDASTLQETGQGLENSNAESGRSKALIINQVAQNMSTLRQNLADGIERAWRIMTQEVRANWDIPTLLKYTSEDGGYAVKEWSKADLRSTRDIKIAIGSFTQYTPQQKAQLAQFYASLGAIDDPDEMKRVLSAAVHPHMGLVDDPVVQRVRSQMSEWKDGPTPEFEMQYQQFKMAEQAATEAAAQRGMQEEVPRMLEMRGVQMPTGPFIRIPTDVEPKVAQKRHRELSRFAQTKAVNRYGPEWAEILHAECEMMRQAAIPVAPWLMTSQEQMFQQQMMGSPPKGDDPTQPPDTPTTNVGEIVGEANRDAQAEVAARVPQS